MITLFSAELAQARDYGEGHANGSPAIALDNAQGRHEHWRAVGRLQVDQASQKSRCTGALIDSRNGESQAAGPAYILTSGHCVTRHSLNFTHNTPVQGYIDFDYFLGNMQRTQRHELKQIVSATVRGADLALIELQTPLQELLDLSIEPLKLSHRPPADSVDLMIVGVPSGHENAPGLRLSLCAYEGAEDLVEEVFVFRGFYKHRCAGIAPGSSGSPLLDRRSNHIIGVTSTSTGRAKAENRCQTNAPCEIKGGQPAWSPDTQYSSPATGLQNCFVHGRFNPDAEQCTLRSTLEMTLGEDYSPKTYRRITLDRQGNPVFPTWSWPFSLNTPMYRYKTTRSATECESPHYYKDAADAANVLIDDPVGPEAGMHFLCIIGVTSQAQRPAQEMMNKPVVIAMELAPAGPTRMPELTIDRLSEGGYRVEPYFSAPSLWVYTFKSGEPDAVDCDEPDGYTPHFEGARTYEASKLPLKLCSKAHDLSKQASLPRTDLLMP
ncbi:trypsin-like serine peptidase [Pseudomonas sp. NPDC088444]|uniref:trypsin-like serine peptidase n=1 Tax=Pseudomonas sp. NPDC088444 TaxID=3364456 RepID=UPI00384E4EB4